MDDIYDESNDEEDSERENEMDKYEKTYNFRYEDPNAANITTHAREVPAEESLRRKDSTRKEARERAKQRKEFGPNASLQGSECTPVGGKAC